MPSIKEFMIIAPEQYADFARQLTDRIAEQPGCKSSFLTTKQVEDSDLKRDGSHFAILLGNAEENPVTQSCLPGITNLCNQGGACFGFSHTTAVAFGEGKLEQREEFKPVLEKCGRVLEGRSEFSTLGVSLAAATIIFLPKNILMPGLVRVATRIRRKEWERQLRTEQTKSALVLFLSEHFHSWAGLKRKSRAR